GADCNKNNDGLTKQQLDLIHQIMQQTQQQAAAHHKHHSAKASSASSKSRTWSVQVGPLLST
ncbi:hypothetical protein L9F63_023265, partial [Diploptera punctata]